MAHCIRVTLLEPACYTQAACWSLPMRLSPCLLSLLLCSVTCAQAVHSSGAPLQVPSGTALSVVIMRAIPRKKVAVHDRVFAQTVVSVVRNGHVLIPTGTELQGEVVAFTQPSFFHQRASLTVHFPEAVIGGSYVLPLDDELSGKSETVQLTLAENIGNEFLIDSGTVFDLPLHAALTVDPARLPAFSQGPGAVGSSDTCHPSAGTAGTPGTPGTVIPGTPGTPDTVIPGANGAPPTVIPGTPATPPTVLPGLPGTPGTPGRGCQPSPRVTSVVFVP